MVTTLAAFGVITLMSSPYRDHEAETLSDYRGLFWKYPNLAAILTAALLSLAVIPLTGTGGGMLILLMMAMLRGSDAVSCDRQKPGSPPPTVRQH